MSYVIKEYFPVKGVYFDPRTKCLFIPGSWLPLILMMAVFLTQYIIAAPSVLNSSLVESTHFVISLSLVFGVFSGCFFARAMNMWRVTRMGSVCEQYR
nr:DUF6622 family protein [uncultured Shewanella sp.]